MEAGGAEAALRGACVPRPWTEVWTWMEMHGNEGIAMKGLMQDEPLTLVQLFRPRSCCSVPRG